MMKIPVILAAVSLFATSFTSVVSPKEKTGSLNNAAINGFAVVELFTSEGCSSCPPADAAVANLLNQYKSNVYVLGYHVDYWNNLGWRDVFSSADYSRRQRNYAGVLKSSVYTPQVVINGDEQFVGSDESRLQRSVTNDLKQSSETTLSIDATVKNDKTVNVSFKTNNTADEINVALIQLSAVSNVQRGENSGATLHHVNIVRDLETLPAKAAGIITLHIPTGLSAKDCNVIAFTQNASNRKITAASQTVIK